MSLSTVTEATTAEAGPLILCLDDEPDIRRLLAATLERYGYRVRAFGLGRDLLAAVDDGAAPPPALCILDLGLPDGDGLDLVRQVRALSDCAVIILTGRGDTADRVLGLEVGADDYVVKPFEPRELVARVRSVLRRTQPARVPIPAPAPAAGGEVGMGGSQARFAGWLYRPEAHTLEPADPQAAASVPPSVLSTGEAALLLALLQAPGRILSRERLMDALGLDGDRTPFDRAIDMRVSRLRKRLGDDAQEPVLLKTVYGAGYMFCAKVVWE